MLVAGLDAATRTGFAVVEAGKGKPRVLGRGVVDASWGELRRVLADVLVPLQVTLAIIEVPYMGDNPHTAIAIGRIVGRWEQEVERAGIRVELARAQQWQSGILSGLIGSGSVRAQRKKAAKLWVRQFYGIEVASEDEADAIGIATWGAQRAVVTGGVRTSRGGGGAANG